MLEMTTKGSPKKTDVLSEKSTSSTEPVTSALVLEPQPTSRPRARINRDIRPPSARRLSRAPLCVTLAEHVPERLAELLPRALAGDRGALARAISQVEAGAPGCAEALAALSPRR